MRNGVGQNVIVLFAPNGNWEDSVTEAYGVSLEAEEFGHTPLINIVDDTAKERGAVLSDVRKALARNSVNAIWVVGHEINRGLLEIIEDVRKRRWHPPIVAKSPDLIPALRDLGL